MKSQKSEVRSRKSGGAIFLKKGRGSPVIIYSLLSALFIFALCLPLITSAKVQTENSVDDASARARNLHQWGAVTSFHGLPSDRVRAIAQDADGVMWFGTERGLAKYDGRRVVAIASEELPAGRVLALRVDAEGVLWVGTESGAARLVNGDFRKIEETANKVVTAIITPEAGRALLATEQGVIFDCRKNADNSLAVKAIPQEPLTSADVEHPGQLQISSLAIRNDTIYMGTRSRGLMQVEDEVAKEIQSRPRPFFISALEVDTRGRLWFGAKARSDDSGLYEADNPLKPVKVESGIGTVTSLSVDEQGCVWAGTEGQGAFRFRDAKKLDHFSFAGTAGGLRSDNVYATFVDREGVVWFGTDRGVCRYDPHSPRSEDISQDRQANFIRTLFRRKNGQLLCGTNGGLFAYDEKKSSWQPYTQFQGKTVFAIAEDDAGRLLIGSSTGLYLDVKPEQPKPQIEEEVIDESTLPIEGFSSSSQLPQASPLPQAQPSPTPQPPNESVRAIEAFQDSLYIAIYGRGVERLDGRRRTLVWPTDSTDARLREVTCLHADADGKLWIGTAHAGVFSLAGRQAEAGEALDKLREAAVWAIAGSTTDGLWFATGKGLYKFHAGQLIEVAPGVDVRSVVVNDEQSGSPQIWCATSGGGLLRIAIDSEFGVLTSQLDVEQGLSSQKAFALLWLPEGQDGDELLIGTTRGLVRYSPGKSAPVLTPTRILSRRLHTADETRAGLNLDYPQNSLALDVAALSSRTFPEQFQYAFTLRDSAGNVIKKKLSRDAQFLMDNLKPGKYRVEARAFTRDLISSAPLAFDFTVAKAPFPRTTVALSVLLALALLALLWAIIEHRRIKQTSAELATANHDLAGARLQLANEAERERRRIARDLHDQTLADLRHLLMMTDQVRANGGGAGNGHETSIDPTIFRSEIEAVSNEIRRICEDLSPSVLENVGFAAALEWALANAVAHAPQDSKFDYEFVCPEDFDERLELGPGTQMQIYRIAQEVVTNICRHAGAKHVSMMVGASDQSDFVLKIEDDGRDFYPHVKREKKGRGLANIRARASLIEAEVNWSRSKNDRNSFTLMKKNGVKILIQDEQLAETL